MASDIVRLLDVCQQALDLPPEARRTFLDTACGGDSDLRRAVEALLAEERQAKDFLETPAWPSSEQRITPGTHMGPYEVVALAGAGGMGEVYKARDTRLGRTVAIKVLPPVLASDPVRRARFRNEGRAVSSLNHPHICTLYDVGADRGFHYLVMEYLEGETLAARLARGPIPLGDAMNYAVQMADALAYAHERGFIHRDLKPANVMVTAAGIKLLDFGIAKLERHGRTQTDPSVTAEGVVIGTIAYMAPEQLRGTAVDARSDLFSLGAVLHEVLTGTPAFHGATQTSVIAAVLQDNPPAVSTLQPAAPPAMDNLVRKCLSKDPANRWQSAADVLEELRTIHSSGARGWRARLRPRRVLQRPGRRTALLMAAVALATITGAVALRGVIAGEWPWRFGASSIGGAAEGSAAGGFESESDVMLTAITREPGAESFPSLAPDGREFVYATGPLDYFGESDIYRRDVGFDRPVNLTPDSPGADIQPAFSPDGNWIAFRSDREGGGIWLMARDGGSVRRLTREGYNPAWSPDGRRIAYATVHTMASPFANSGQGSAIHVVDVDTGATRRLPPSSAAQPSWSPHGHRVAYWANGAVSTCASDGTDAGVALEPGAPGRSNWNPVWSPDGTYLYFLSDRNGPMHLWRVRIDERSGRALARPERAPVQMPSTFVAHPSFDSSGQRLVFASVPQASSIQQIDFDTATATVRGRLEPVTTGSVVAVWPEVSPDGTHLAIQMQTDKESINVSTADGGGLRLLVGGEGTYRVPRWSPDGRRLAFYSSRGGQGNVWVVDADGANPRQVSRSGKSPIIFPAWAPDGRLSASEAGPPHRSFVFNPDKPWEAAGNQALLPGPDPGTQFVPWSWSPGGDRLAGFGRPIGGRQGARLPGILVLTLATGKYARVTTDAAQPTPVWLPDGQRLLYALKNRVMTVDLRTGQTREVLNVGAGRLEIAAGGGFSVSARTGKLYVAPVTREGDIWFARAKSTSVR